MLTGSCLCRAVRYQIDGARGRREPLPLRPVPQGAWRRVRDLRPRPLRGLPADVRRRSIARYQASPQATRTFCRTCGSNLQWCPTGNDEYFALALGTLDDDPGVRPERHIFVGSKAPWYVIEDRLSQFPEYPGADQA